MTFDTRVPEADRRMFRAVSADLLPRPAGRCASGPSHVNFRKDTVLSMRTTVGEDSIRLVVLTKPDMMTSFEIDRATLRRAMALLEAAKDE